jgi:hypothetical protein
LGLLYCHTTTTVVSGSQEKVKTGFEKWGIKRILFQSRKSVGPETLDECRRAGIETVVACPLMSLRSFRHRIHGFFAGGLGAL